MSSTSYRGRRGKRSFARRIARLEGSNH
jgi:hypothetical protein